VYVSEARKEAQQAADTFVAELQHWRDVAGLAMKALSQRMGYDASYVGKVESGNARPTEDFAARADQVLNAGRHSPAVEGVRPGRPEGQPERLPNSGGAAGPADAAAARRPGGRA
jgi:transcriptional regulator with XRE-family HTH domain